MALVVHMAVLARRAPFCQCLVVIALGWSGCGQGAADSSLIVEQLDGGVRSAGRWRYASSAVDVDLTLSSVVGAQDCETEARLMTDEAIAGREVYRLHARCDELQLTQDGDLVLMRATTGHDWSTEPLDVDTDNERIHLGPWSPHGAGAAPPSYRFTLLSRECGDCECPSLRRSDGEETLELPLGRFCD